MWRRVVRQTLHKTPTDPNWKRTRYGAVAICIDSSTDVVYRTALRIVTRNRSVVALTVTCWLLDVEIYTSGVADCPAPDTSHLFSVLPFPLLPILWNVAFLTCITVQFHCIPQWYVFVSPASSVGDVCSMPKKFKQKLFFRQLTGFYYFISRTKGTPQI